MILASKKLSLYKTNESSSKNILETLRKHTLIEITGAAVETNESWIKIERPKKGWLHIPSIEYETSFTLVQNDDVTI